MRKLNFVNGDQNGGSFCVPEIQINTFFYAYGNKVLKIKQKTKLGQNKNGNK